MLAELLNEKAQDSLENLPKDLLAAFDEGINVVRNSGIETNAKQAGDDAINAELTGWDGSTVQLQELWQAGPIVLMWYRGGWCPYCNIQLRAMQNSLAQLEETGARLVVLSPELPEKAKETAAANEIGMVTLYDKESAVASQYGILFDLPEMIIETYRDKLKMADYNGSDKMALPLAATYVINTQGQITYAFLNADYKKRAEPADVIDAVRQAAV